MYIISFIIAILLGTGTMHIAEHCEGESINIWMKRLMVPIVLQSVFICFSPKIIGIVSFVLIIASIAVACSIIIIRQRQNR